ncbi:uncharacterized protein UTRI_06606 [Ustilago trichophora]|uniref:Uncharacterized protein n=1 Tax=Ustilago trichophora TaxID=86804 RepID=A0A5C3EP36_9BASI|nr:uncharacterized protein UTRI_06606 [Ustilago trichophora]
MTVKEHHPPKRTGVVRSTSLRLKKLFRPSSIASKKSLDVSEPPSTPTSAIHSDSSASSSSSTSSSSSCCSAPQSSASRSPPSSSHFVTESEDRLWIRASTFAWSWNWDEASFSEPFGLEGEDVAPKKKKEKKNGATQSLRPHNAITSIYNITLPLVLLQKPPIHHKPNLTHSSTQDDEVTPSPASPASQP